MVSAFLVSFSRKMMRELFVKMSRKFWKREVETVSLYVGREIEGWNMIRVYLGI